MILRSIHIEGYRCFVGPVQVGPFSERLNVIHAPNATGKSTLFEALRRVLLDSHRTSGREVESLRPWGRVLAPTVTLEFAHRGTDYRLRKRFLDAAVSQLARRENGAYVPLMEGEAADERVRKMLTQSPTGRGFTREDNWGLAQVLWAPQGSLDLPELSGDLVSDIRGVLGAQVAGPDAGPLERRIEEAYLRIFTPTGRFRTGQSAPLVVELERRVAQSAAEQRLAAERQQSFEAAARNVESLRARLTASEREAKGAKEALAKACSESETYKTKVAEKEAQGLRVEFAKAQYDALKQRVEDIGKHHTELAEARKALLGLEEEKRLRVREVEQCGKRVTQAREALEAAKKGLEAAGQFLRAARAAEDYLDELERIKKLEQRLGGIAAATESIREAQEGLDGPRAPDSETLRKIREAIKDRDEAQVRIDAALITLEIVPAKAGLRAVVSHQEGGELGLVPGETVEFKGSSEVAVELIGVAQLRARGPCPSIEGLREELTGAARSLDSLTGPFGTADLEELQSRHREAEELRGKIAESKAKLAVLLGDETQTLIEEERVEAASNLQELLEDHPAWKERRPEASAMRSQAEEAKCVGDAAVESATAELEEAGAEFSSARAKEAEAGATLKARQEQVDNLSSKLAELTADGKTDEDRGKGLGALALEWHGASAALDGIAGELDGFDKDPCEAEAELREKLALAEEAATDALSAERTEVGELGGLVKLGTYSAWARNEEEAARLGEEHAREKMRTETVKLLYDTVASCRAEALAAVAAPVERAATRTLHRIAGEGLGGVEFGDDFRPVGVRPAAAGASVGLKDVSGGEREQIFLATRLALAEVLAEGERQLVVLDDVLTYTDEPRLERSLRVLEEAAEHLQVLIITCHPQRYRGLTGATFIDLEAALRRFAPA